MKMMMKKDLKEEFIRLALRRTEWIKKGSVSKANQICDKLRQICKLKYETEDQGNAFFSELITHEEPAVRLWAACFLYPSNPARATAELQALKEVEDSSIVMAAGGHLWRIERGEFQITFD